MVETSYYSCYFYKKCSNSLGLFSFIYTLAFYIILVYFLFEFEIYRKIVDIVN